jgi:hypothetical protein
MALTDGSHREAKFRSKKAILFARFNQELSVLDRNIDFAVASGPAIRIALTPIPTGACAVTVEVQRFQE